jgi:hypothetical protein
LDEIEHQAILKASTRLIKRGRQLFGAERRKTQNRVVRSRT